MTFPVVIHHNPDCGTSRNVLAIIRAAGYQPTVIDYLTTGWTRPQLLALFAAANITPTEALRIVRSPAEAMGLTAPGISDDQLLDAMTAHPRWSWTCWTKCHPAHWRKKTGNSSSTRKETVLPDTPNIEGTLFPGIDEAALLAPPHKTHAPRILILYGSIRPRSFSRLSGEEAGRILTRLGAEVRFFNPSGLPLVDDGADATHPKVRELRDLVAWSEGMVWSSPERHGAMTGLMKTQIDWIPLSDGAVRPTQGKTLAVMQVSGGSQSFNAVNQMRILGRWMRLITIPNQSSIPKAFQEFDEMGRMRPSPLYDRIVDVMEELMKFTLLTRDRADYLVDRYSERKESAEALMKRVNLSAAT